MNASETRQRHDDRSSEGSVAFWTLLAVLLALVCAGLIGVNIARWQDGAADTPPADVEPAGVSEDG